MKTSRPQIPMEEEKQDLNGKRKRAGLAIYFLSRFLFPFFLNHGELEVMGLYGPRRALWCLPPAVLQPTRWDSWSCCWIFLDRHFAHTLQMAYAQPMKRIEDFPKSDETVITIQLIATKQIVMNKTVGHFNN